MNNYLILTIVGVNHLVILEKIFHGFNNHSIFFCVRKIVLTLPTETLKVLTDGVTVALQILVLPV